MQNTAQIEIRDTTLDDVPAMRAMHAQSWRDTYPNEKEGISREFIEQHTARWLTPEGIENSREHMTGIIDSPDHLHKIAVHNGEIVGLMHITHGKQGCHLQALYVDKRYHGSGLAQRLMERALDWCGASRPISLQVAAYNERAKAFYRKYGFEEKSGTDELFAKIIPVITMEKKGELR